MSDRLESRKRLAVVLLLVGTVGLLAAASAYFAYEHERLREQSPHLTPDQRQELRERATGPLRVLLLAVGLTFGFFAVSYAFVRWSRAFRAQLGRKPPRPTPVEDVWSMYRLPDDTTDARGDPPRPPGAR